NVRHGFATFVDCSNGLVRRTSLLRRDSFERLALLLNVLLQFDRARQARSEFVCPLAGTLQICLDVLESAAVQKRLQLRPSCAPLLFLLETDAPAPHPRVERGLCVRNDRRRDSTTRRGRQYVVL